MSQIFKYDCAEREWAAFLNARDSGEITEIDEAMFDYWIEVLPPIYMNRAASIQGVSRRVNGRFFCARTGEMNRG